MNFRFLFWCLPVCLVIACGGSDDSDNNGNTGGGAGTAGSGGATQQSPEALACDTTDAHLFACARLATDYCKKFFECDANGAIPDYWDQALCAKTEKERCLSLTHQFGVPADVTAKAADVIGAMSCGDFLREIGVFMPFGGVSNVDEPCTDKTICLGNTVRCSTEQQPGQEGVCQQLTDDMPCEIVDHVFTCPAGMVCNVVEEKCKVINNAPPKDPGATCAANELCAGTYTCENGVCTAAPPLETQTTIGAPCGTEQIAHCGVGEACINGDETTTPGECVAQAGEGEPCPAPINPVLMSDPCLGGLTCVDGTCQAPACK